VGAGRNTGGTTRDRLVRDALSAVTAPYVVCIDADTVTERPLGELVGNLVGNGFDLVSIRLVPSNVRGWLGQLQAHEYRVAMMLRRIAPWMLSGACHAARSPVLREIMNRHSLFFQGNDVEAGLLAKSLEYRVGHIPFVVPTAVPTTVKAWLRQRLAWSGGEFRLFAVNFGLVARHPVLWLYGSVVVLLGSPFRWDAVVRAPWMLALLFVLYAALLSYVNWSQRNRWLLLMPLYAAFSSLVLTPLGLISYVYMAIRSRNLGRISRSGNEATRGNREARRVSGDPRPGRAVPELS
jgi:cellulose synthase/poly-beta-1,6-N-acetylglucosamine synthase-like glycosyltransferase